MMKTFKLPRLAVAAAFFVNGAGFASWVVRIPEVRERIGLTESGLGMALLAMAVGALIAMPTAGAWISRWGSRVVYRVAALGLAGAIALAASSTTPLGLAAALLMLGAGNSAVSVSLNSQAAAIERKVRRSVLSGLHALYSIGALFGAGVGGLAASLQISAVAHLSVAAVIAALIPPVLARALLPARADARPDGQRFARPSRDLLVLGAVAFCVLFGEGAAANWAAVYLRDVTGAGAGVAAASFALFSLMMAVGRLSGDLLLRRFGGVRLLQGGALLASAGVALMLAMGSARGALIGIAGLGAGLSVIYPALLGLVGRLYSAAPAPAIAAVSTMGYAGFLAGPALIGLAAELTSLKGAFALVGLASLIVAATAKHIPAGRVAAPAGRRGHAGGRPELASTAG